MLYIGNIVSMGDGPFAAAEGRNVIHVSSEAILYYYPDSKTFGWDYITVQYSDLALAGTFQWEQGVIDYLRAAIIREMKILEMKSLYQNNYYKVLKDAIENPVILDKEAYFFYRVSCGG